MATLALGPFTFAGDRLALFLALVFLLVAGMILSLRVDDRLGTWAMSIVSIGIVAARLGHMAARPIGFVDDPVAVLRIADGGLMLSVGLAAVAAYTAYAMRGRRMRLWSFGTLSAVVLVWTVSWQLATATEAIAAPRTAYPILKGEAVRLDDFRGKPTVVNLWATWCPPCPREMPMLAKAAGERSDVNFVFANQGEGPDAIIRYLAQSGLDLPALLLDQGFEISRHYSVQGYPATLFLDAEGTVRTMHFGEIDRPTLDAKIHDAGS
ncbi:TlpA family protein disulfide reductase [Aureimonas sp. N4]|uniref:TlpA family protein disulfide reductase n=1 Tax=Aureimonas sp. N4 TaxID=1638165 RepID=UPI000785F9ED|nr:TlpA disulfide reductase family protein [Aureimonas sp. N4]